MNDHRRDRPITIYAYLLAKQREIHDYMICGIMSLLMKIYPSVTFDWEETP